MALGGRARLQTQSMHRQHLVAMQGHQSMGGPNKAHAAPAGQLTTLLQLVAHHFGYGQLGQCMFKGQLQARHQTHAVNRLVQHQHLGLALTRALKLGHHGGIKAQCPQLFQQRWGGLALGVQAHAHRHEFVLHLARWGLCEHLVDVHGQPAR